MRRFFGLVIWVWGYLCLGVFASAQSNTSRDKDFTFLYLSRPGVFGNQTLEGLRKPFDAALAQEAQPAFVLVNGGLTRSGNADEWTQFRTVVESLPPRFPVYALPEGADYTHDPISKADVFRLFYGEGKHEAKGRPARSNKVEDRLYQSFDVEGVHVVLLDAAIPLKPHNQYAHLDTEQLNWLDKDLKKLKKDTHILVFLNTSFGSEAISTRPLANEFELWQVLRPHNVAAIFALTRLGEQHVVVKPLNSTQIVSLPAAGEGFVYRVRVTPLRISIDAISLSGTKQPAETASFTLTFSSRKSVLRAAFDDDGNPFLVRRHPIGLFEPRAVSDNPENETGEYRIDEGNFQPMKRDARDIWRSPFRTESLPIGIHTATVRVTSETENRTPHYAEIIFEVERDNKEATRRWASNIDNPIVSNPVLSGKTLYISGTDTKLYALDTETGKKRTLLTARGAFYASPCLANGTLYIGATDKTFYAVNADTGSLKWKFETDSPLAATAAVAQDTVCFASADKVYGLDIRTGKQTWVQNLSGFFQSQAAADETNFYLGGQGNALIALDAKTGTLRWKITPPTAAARIELQAALMTPVVSSGKVYCNSGDDTFAAYDARTGRPLWELKSPLAGNASVGDTMPTLSGTTIYLVCNVSNAGRLYAVNTSDGTIRWQTPLQQNVVNSGAVLSPDGSSLAVVGVRGSVSVHSTQNGKKLWGYELGPGNVFSTPQYDGQTVYTATMANDVQALNAPGYDSRKKGKAANLAP